MGKTKGAKDKKPRSRRKSSEAEKEARKEKKARSEQYQHEREKALRERERKQAKANFFSGHKTPTNESDEMSDEEEVQYVEIPVNECNGTADLGSFVATIDDDTEEQDAEEIPEEGGGTQEGGESSSVMNCFTNDQEVPVDKTKSAVRNVGVQDVLSFMVLMLSPARVVAVEQGACISVRMGLASKDRVWCIYIITI